MSTGCTACVVLVTPTKIFTANAGDSRAVLCRKGQAVPLSFDHKPMNEGERKRIQAAGGSITGGRINGVINLSRGLGDLNFKRQKNRAYDDQLVICRPDITEVTRSPGEDEFIIMGCDGVWEQFAKDSQLMISRVASDRKSASDGLAVVGQLLDSLLARGTEEEVGCDNMTAILVEFF
jgi:serine/threonine protein phosphatase PrpC